jgi:hypothetical protein
MLDEERPPEGARPHAGAPALPPDAEAAFARCPERFRRAVARAAGLEAAALEHSELESRLGLASRETFGQVLQGRFDLRAVRERPARQPVTGSDGVRRGRVEHGRGRALKTVCSGT